MTSDRVWILNDHAVQELSKTCGFTITETLLPCFFVRVREVSQDCQETMVKKANLERASQARLWVWCCIDWSVSPAFIIEFKLWYLQVLVFRHWEKEILFEYQDQCSLNTLADENAGHYCEVLAHCTLRSSYMLCAASSQIWLWVSLLSFLKYRIVGDRESIEQKVSYTIPLLDPGC